MSTAILSTFTLQYPAFMNQSTHPNKISYYEEFIGNDFSCFLLDTKIDIPEKLVLPFKSYMLLFPQFCSFFYKKEVELEIDENNLETYICFNVKNYKNQKDLKDLKKMLKNFVGLLNHQYPLPILEKIAKPISDINKYHKISLLIEEGIRHFNKLVYLEYQLDLVSLLPNSSLGNSKPNDFYEVKNLVKDLEQNQLKEENEKLQKIVESIKEKIKTVEKEKKRLSKNIEELINKYEKNKFSKEEILDLFKKNRLKKVFQIFSMYDDEDIKNQTVLLESQYYDLNQNFHSNYISAGFYYEKFNKLKISLLNIINSLG